ncbi:MAG TPA: hypothetical protein VGI87_14545 [Solirubrobacteraceae bacterium]|jgi:hypothetical protein
MESTSTPNYQQVIVDVPEERVAEFHAFFARFLAYDPSERGPRAGRRGPRGRHGYGRHGHGHGRHGRRCARSEDQESATAAEQREPEAQPTDTAEV